MERHDRHDTSNRYYLLGIIIGLKLAKNPAERALYSRTLGVDLNKPELLDPKGICDKWMAENFDAVDAVIDSMGVHP